MRAILRLATPLLAIVAALSLLALLQCGGDSGSGVAGPVDPGPGGTTRFDLLVSLEEAVSFDTFHVVVDYPQGRVEFLGARTVQAASTLSLIQEADNGSEIQLTGTGGVGQGPGGLVRLTFRLLDSGAISRDDFSVLLCLIAEPGASLRPALACTFDLVDLPSDGMPEIACTAPSQIAVGGTGVFIGLVTVDGVIVQDGTPVQFTLAPAGKGSITPASAFTVEGIVEATFSSDQAGQVLTLTVRTTDGAASCSRNVTVSGSVCPDADGDGFLDAACGGLDCDDADPAVNPAIAEVCANGLDDDCDGFADDQDSEDCPPCLDRDGDGYTSSGCGGLDCNDLSPAINPGADEICDDARDNDCDGAVDVSDPECAGCPDADRDGYREASCGGRDCRDDDPRINPDFPEVCDDGADNDCDGSIDTQDPDCAGCPDADGDGFRAGSCGGRDCRDTDPAINPDAEEICDDLRDNDCDGLTDGQDPICNCDDLDGDGYKDAACGGRDCDDADPLTNPGRPEACDDGVDNDCDGLVDTADPACTGCDDDNDGFAKLSCGGRDCDDADPARNPGLAEECADGIDNDCDGLVDADDPVCAFCDDDDDGFLDVSCGGDDCDDNNAGIHPGRTEFCADARDNNCDGFIDCQDPECEGSLCAEDGFACTSQSCELGVCVSRPRNERCQDGAFCNGAELCDPSDPVADVFTGCIEATAGPCDEPGVGCSEADDACTEENCTDGRDNDGDGLADCFDSDCESDPSCPERDCDDGVDNDGDTLADCADADCEARLCSDGFSCTSGDVCSAGVCAGTPNDGRCDDGLFCSGTETCDPSDPGAGADGCLAGTPPCPPGECNEATDLCGEDCTNGVDDDGDTLVDCEDDGCDGSICADDGVTCTEATCQAGACVTDFVDSLCSNGLFCDGDEVCDPTDPGADLDGCLAGSDPCPGQACDEVNDICGEDCSNGVDDDGDTLADCADPACDGLRCDDTFACTASDTCTGGACSGTFDDAFCDDAQFCTGTEVCDPSDGGADVDGCVAGTDPCQPGETCDETNDECIP